MKDLLRIVKVLFAGGLLPGVIPLLLPFPAEAQLDPAVWRDPQVEAVVAHLVGTMDTSAQAIANPDAPNVRMITCRIVIAAEASSATSVFLYQEQALSAQLDRPYRQRFLQISPSGFSQSIQSISFKPNQSESWIGLCNQPEANRVVQKRELGEAVCTVFLRPMPLGYVGQTPVDGCPTQFRGAVRITNRIFLHDQGMDTWDRGLDALGNQIWGADGESYQFRWVDPSE